MSGRILKTLVLALVLGGVFVASAAAVPVTEPSIYSVSSSSSHVIVSEKTVGLTAAPAAPTIYSDHGVLVPEPKTAPTVVAASDGSGFDWSDAGVASAISVAALLALSAAALGIRRQHRPLAH